MRKGQGTHSKTSLPRKKKGDDIIYTVKITGEQIKTIRSFYMRTEQLYGHRGVTRMIQEDGTVKCVSMFECYFCGKGSYESAAAIPHEKDCIIPLAEKEFDALNAQFIDVLNKES